MTASLIAASTVAGKPAVNMAIFALFANGLQIAKVALSIVILKTHGT